MRAGLEDLVERMKQINGIRSVMRLEEEELNKLNLQLQVRAEKFGSEFTPLTMVDYKLFKIQKASETGNI